MGIGNDLDLRARNHELGHDSCAIGIGLSEIFRIDRIHARKVLRIGQVDENLGDVVKTAARRLERLLEIVEGEPRLRGDVAALDRPVGFDGDLRGV